MGILHDMLAKIHLAHDNALALADPEQVKTAATHGFFGATADLVHSLEARIVSIEAALFGTKEAPATPAVASAEPSSTEPVAPVVLAEPAPAVAEPAPAAPVA